MCVIIHRKPGAELPFDMLKSACLVNPDGFGLVFPDRGKLEMRRVYSGKGNSPDQVAKFLEDAKDLNAFVHLRYKTKGAVDLTNVHPFTVASAKKDGIDVQFMHNGTLSEFGNTEFCDSRIFAHEIVRPLYLMTAAQVGKEKALYHPLFGKLLAKYAGSNSLFTLVDSLGNSLIVNKKQGFDFQWGWASNKYSFDRYHREPTTTYSSYSSQTYQDWKRDSHQGTNTKAGKAVVGFTSALNDPPWDDKTAKQEPKVPLPSVAKVNEVPVIVAENELKDTDPRITFCDVANIHDLSDVTCMSRENIEDLVQDFPEHATLLIMDLLAELYDRQQERKAA